MYKKVYLLFVLTSGCTTLAPMEILLQSTSHCEPLKIFASLLQEYKPIVCTSAAALVGGFFIYDFFYNRSVIRQLQNEVIALQADVQTLRNSGTPTSVLNEISRVEKALDDKERNLIQIGKTLNELIQKLDVDLNYLWKFIFTPQAIIDYNIRENHYNIIEKGIQKPFIYRPYLPLHEGGTIHNIVKEGISKAFGISDIYEQLRTNAAPSPRNHAPFNFKPDALRKKKITEGVKKGDSSPTSSSNSSPSESSDEEKENRNGQYKNRSKSTSPPKEISPRKIVPEKKGDEDD